MYPNLYYVFKELFGLEISALKIVNSFGFFVAIAFLVSAWVLVKELKRKQREGLLTYEEVTITVGEPASVGELLLNFVLGFVFGYKILGVFFTPGALNDPQAFIFSGNGNWAAGILLGLFFAVLKWRDKNKKNSLSPRRKQCASGPAIG